jgi:hypothetical protein
MRRGLVRRLCGRSCALSTDCYVVGAGVLWLLCVVVSLPLIGLLWLLRQTGRLGFVCALFGVECSFADVLDLLFSLSTCVFCGAD